MSASVQRLNSELHVLKICSKNRNFDFSGSLPREQLPWYPNSARRYSRPSLFRQHEDGIRRSDKSLLINSTHANFNLPPSLTKVRQNLWEFCGTACIVWENLGHGMRETRVIWLCFSWEWKGGFVNSLCFQWRINLACDGHWPDLHCLKRI